MKAIIIDDELSGLNNLQRIITQRCSDIEIVGTAQNLTDGAALFDTKRNYPDVAFLDIKIGEDTVFSLLESLRPIDFEIIFVSAYDKYAMQACKFSSIDFIHKPIDPNQLEEAVARIEPRRNSRINERLAFFQQAYFHPNAFRKMSVSAIDGTHFINFSDILRLEGSDNYTNIIMKDNTQITVSKTIKWYEKLLEDKNFYRVHKSYLINLNFMKKFVKGDGGYVIMDDNMKIEVSRRRRAAFLEKLKMLEGVI